MNEQSPHSEIFCKNLLKELHKDFKLAGNPKNSILNITEELLSYLVLLLRDEIPKKTLSTDEEWFKLIDILMSHGTIPLLYWKIGRLPPDIQPSETVINRMRTLYLESSAASLKMEIQLSEMAAAFKRIEIDFIVLKGPSLAWSEYPCPATRPSGDIDIIVRPRDFVRSRQVLMDIGYKSLDNRFDTTRSFDYEEVLVHPEDKQVSIELHWDLLRYPIMNNDEPIEELFTRAIDSDSFCNFKILHPVDSFLYLSLHLFAKHNQSIRLIWIFDLYLLARKFLEVDDWQILRQRCTEWNAVYAVKRAIKTAEVWNGLKLPAGVDDELLWSKPSEAEVKIWRHAIGHHKSILSIAWLSRFSSLSLFEKIKCVFHILFPSPEIMRYNFSPVREYFLPVSYLQRWWNWVRIALKL